MIFKYFLPTGRLFSSVLIFPLLWRYFKFEFPFVNPCVLDLPQKVIAKVSDSHIACFLLVCLCNLQSNV